MVHNVFESEGLWRPPFTFSSRSHFFHFSWRIFFFRVIGYFRQEFFIVFKFWLVGVALSVVVSLTLESSCDMLPVPFRDPPESIQCSMIGDSKMFLGSSTFVSQCILILTSLSLLQMFSMSIERFGNYCATSNVG